MLITLKGAVPSKYESYTGFDEELTDEMMEHAPKLLRCNFGDLKEQMSLFDEVDLQQLVTYVRVM